MAVPKIQNLAKKSFTEQELVENLSDRGIHSFRRFIHSFNTLHYPSDVGLLIQINQGERTLKFCRSHILDHS